MTDKAADLKQLLINIFDDSIVEPQERDTLSAFTDSMSADETLSVFKTFLQEKWGEAIADDVLTSDEIRLLGHIMVELDLESEHLPLQARMALKDKI